MGEKVSCVDVYLSVLTDLYIHACLHFNGLFVLFRQQQQSQPHSNIINYYTSYTVQILEENCWLHGKVIRLTQDLHQIT